MLAEPIAPELAERFQADWAGCLAGAVAEDDYLSIVRQAGFTQLRGDEERPQRGRIATPGHTGLSLMPADSVSTQPIHHRQQARR